MTPPNVQFAAAEDWIEQPLTNRMRTAHYKLPRAEGDDEDGDLIVFYFGPRDGGTVEANLARWRGMFTTGEGEPLPPDAGEREDFEANGLEVTVLDITGRYAPQAMPGMAPQDPRGDFRMITAVVKTPIGPFFFKITAPPATMQRHAEAIDDALRSVRQ